MEANSVLVLQPCMKEAYVPFIKRLPPISESHNTCCTTSDMRRIGVVILQLEERISTFTVVWSLQSPQFVPSS